MKKYRAINLGKVTAIAADALCGEDMETISDALAHGAAANKIYFINDNCAYGPFDSERVAREYMAEIGIVQAVPTRGDAGGFPVRVPSAEFIAMVNAPGYFAEDAAPMPTVRAIVENPHAGRSTEFSTAIDGAQSPIKLTGPTGGGIAHSRFVALPTAGKWQWAAWDQYDDVLHVVEMPFTLPDVCDSRMGALWVLRGIAAHYIRDDVRSTRGH